MTPLLKQELRDLTTFDETGRINAGPTGVHVLTWARAPWGWVLLHMEPMGDAA